jgi:uncharacterized tellurite resistance protein B-like protein
MAQTHATDQRINQRIQYRICSITSDGQTTMKELEKIQLIQKLNQLSIHELKAYISVCSDTVIKKMAVELYNSKIREKNALEVDQRIQYLKEKISKYR